MKYLLVLVLSAAALAVAVVNADNSDAQAPGSQTLVLKEGKALQEKFIDVKPSSMQRGKASLGDSFLFNTALFDQAKKRVGSLEVECVVVVAGQFGKNAVTMCDGVVHTGNGYTPPRPTGGDIFLSARFVPTEDVNQVLNGVITGGTGIYANARGTFTSVGEPAVNTLTFTTG
jgi:hypothetical protein